MCGRFNNHLHRVHGFDELLQEWPEAVVPRFNVYPSYTVAAFANPVGQPMRWGLVPAWAPTFDSRFATHLARLETVDEKPAFRSAWRKQQRCLIPMAGFYERASEGDRRYHYCSDPVAGGLVAAGLYERWGDQQFSCTILTKQANTPLSEIHHRTPILMTPGQGAEWLSVDVSQAKLLLNQCNINSLVMHAVGDRVGNARNDDAELIEPIL